MSRDLGRLLRPRSIAVIGGGAWCRSVIEQCRKIGFSGPVWPVHRTAQEIDGFRCFRTIADLPEPPDASFIGVNRHATVDIVHELAARGAGGAVCFASGFTEDGDKDDRAVALQQELLAAAGPMPILGPNCYGFINYVDGVLLWPDQHGGKSVDSGVAIITQSSNMAINLTMQKRGLPVAYVLTAGNQAQTGISGLGLAVLEDPRVTALGLHIEGFGDLQGFERLASRAAALNKPIVVLKVGKTRAARAATLSHTASLAGQDAGAQALLDRLGIARVASLPGFVESLKLLHVIGPLPTGRIASISCSGGEAALIADTAEGSILEFPALNKRQTADLSTALGPKVTLANPLDYHTYIWRDTAAMTQAFAAMTDPTLAMTLLIVDFPRSDTCDASDWDCAIDSAFATRSRTGANLAMVATLPELMPEDVAEKLIAGGVVPLCGLDEALSAIAAAVTCGVARKTGDPLPLLLPATGSDEHRQSEFDAKSALAKYGVSIPRSVRITTAKSAAMKAQDIGFPVVLKGEGAAHKIEAGLIALGLNSVAEVQDAAAKMNTDAFLLEAMVTGTIAELLIGVVRDQAHGYVLTLAAGGTWTELLSDRQSLLIPASEQAVERALGQLKINRILQGYRGGPVASRAAIVQAVMAVQAFVIANHGHIAELEINPLMCGPTSAVAADVLLIGEAQK